MEETINSLSPGKTKELTTSYELTQADIDTNGGGDGEIENIVANAGTYKIKK